MPGEVFPAALGDQPKGLENIFYFKSLSFPYFDDHAPLRGQEGERPGGDFPIGTETVGPAIQC